MGKVISMRKVREQEPRDEEGRLAEIVEAHLNYDLSALEAISIAITLLEQGETLEDC